LEEKLSYDEYRGRWDGGDIQKYSITDTHHNGLLNITNVILDSMPEDLSNKEKGYILLKDFDLNVTQCGIIINDGKFIITKSFLKFLKTGNLEVINYSTPEHTLVRFAKKMTEFGFHANHQAEFTKLAFAIDSYDRRNRRMKFGEKYRRLFHKYIASNPLWKEGYMKRENAHNISSSFYLKEKSFYDKENDDVVVLSLLLNEDQEHSWNYIKDFMRYVPEKFTVFQKNFYLMRKLIDTYFFKSQKKFEKNIQQLNEIIDEYGNKSKDDSFYSSFIIPFFIKFGAEGKVVDKNLLKRIFRVISNHPNILSVYFEQNNYDQLVSFDKFVKKLVKTHGDIVFGYLESWNVVDLAVNDRDGLVKDLEKYIEELQRNLKSTSIINKNGVIHGNYKYRELISGYDLKLEGSSMRHCVAGYGRAVESGRSYIIKVQPLCNSKELFRTIELRKITEENFESYGEGIDSIGKYYIVQDMHYRNASSTPEESLEFIESMEKEGLKFLESSKKRLLEAIKRSKETIMNEENHLNNGHYQNIPEIDIDDDIPF
jgi:hypothetical protein